MLSNSIVTGTLYIAVRIVCSRIEYCCTIIPTNIVSILRVKRSARNRMTVLRAFAFHFVFFVHFRNSAPPTRSSQHANCASPVPTDSIIAAAGCVCTKFVTFREIRKMYLNFRAKPLGPIGFPADASIIFYVITQRATHGRPEWIYIFDGNFFCFFTFLHK